LTSSNRLREAARHAGFVVAFAVGVFAGCSNRGTGPVARSRAPGTLFRADTALSVGVAPWALAIADFNGDGAPDIAVANLGSQSVSLLYNAPGGTIFHKNTALASSDTVISFGPSFRPRALAASDINADGMADLVVSLMRDSLQAGLDRIVVLLNNGTTGGRTRYTVGLDQLAGRSVRDLFVGDLDKGEGGVEIVGASSVQGSSPVVVSRPARSSEALDSTINFVGSFPEDLAEGVGVRSLILFWFDTDVLNMNALADPDSDWARITGEVEGREPRKIAVTVSKQTTRINNVSYTQYILTPKEPFRPHEVVKVALTTKIQSAQSNPRRNIYLTEAVEWSFTVEGLRVVESWPERDAVHIPTDATLYLAFNYWLKPQTVSGAFQLLGREREIPLSTSYDPDKIAVTIAPQTAFKAYETVRLIMKPTLRDSTDRETFAGDTLSFQAVGPLVMSTEPANGAVARLDDTSGVGGQRIVLRFNAKMAAPDSKSLEVIGDQSGWHAVGSMSLAEDGTEVTAPVSGSFVGGEWVTAIATDRFVSLEGGYPLAKPHVWRFLIRPRYSASLSLKDPGVGADLAGGTVAGGRFTKADDRGVVLADPSGTLALLLGGEGQWIKKTTIASAPGRQVVRAADLNGDGLLDLVVARADSHCVMVLLNTSGSGSEVTFAQPAVYEVGERPVGLFLGDLNGDGRPEIVTANVSSNDISVLENTGDGTFGRETFYVVGNHPQAVEGADLDGDGDIDLVVANSTANTLTLLRNLTAFKEPPQGP